MAFMFEVFYLAPEDPEREARLTEIVAQGGGHLDFREMPTAKSRSICLTYAFAALQPAEMVAQRVKQLGEYVEGPYPYNDEK
jgi:hypothetical protein